jgi:DMSO/TMAO reductase YedYZ molybdopterin-dependent catalytic subunit
MELITEQAGEAPLNREAERLESFLTPDHFVRCHFAQPRARGEIVVAGRRMSAELLREQLQRTEVVTLECAGNGRLGMAPLPPGEPWKNGAVSTAVWTGVPLASMLSLRDDAVEIVVRGADGFARSLPVGEIERALLALEMNGGPIPAVHGGPVRLVVPGWYGMASVKWVESIEAATQPFSGRFQTESYVYDDGPVTTMRVRSHIVAAGNGTGWGWAWSGDGAIVGVEVSIDAGVWQNAALGPQPWPNAWVRWQTPLFVGRGRHTLRARARDAAGHVQPESPPWNRLGYANNAVEVVTWGHV